MNTLPWVDNMLKEKIAADLESAFSKLGFAQPSVAQLKTACNVSLRTLYKHYPSKEAMIISALEYRHKRYMTFLLSESHSKVSGHVSLFMSQLISIEIKELKRFEY